MITHVSVAWVTLTITYADVHCPKCSRLVMQVPGVRVETRARATTAEAAGVGPLVRCKRCGTYVEAISR